MSASLASAKINAFASGFALNAASFRSNDFAFIWSPERETNARTPRRQVGRKNRNPFAPWRLDAMAFSRFGSLNGRPRNLPQSLGQHLCRLLQRVFFLRPELNLD